MNETNPPSQITNLIQLVVLAALCASVVALAFLGVRARPLTGSAFSMVAGIVWVVMLVVGVALPWALSRR